MARWKPLTRCPPWRSKYMARRCAGVELGEMVRGQVRAVFLVDEYRRASGVPCGAVARRAIAHQVHQLGVGRDARKPDDAVTSFRISDLNAAPRSRSYCRRVTAVVTFGRSIWIPRRCRAGRIADVRHDGGDLVSPLLPRAGPGCSSCNRALAWLEYPFSCSRSHLVGLQD